MILRILELKASTNCPNPEGIALISGTRADPKPWGNGDIVIYLKDIKTFRKRVRPLFDE
ncbi:MAG: hypothetical protein ACKO4S_15205 [Snowella sp.]